MRVISSIDQRVPIKAWANEIEPQAVQQLKNIAKMPFVFKHVAVMPDVHLGMGATVGSVIATKGAIMPAAVGVDIGCGMMAIKTDFDYRVVQDKLPQIRHQIERDIPVGFSKHPLDRAPADSWSGWDEITNDSLIDESLLMKARQQMGTLGGGNHFIEICLDLEKKVWIMLHSGSRGIGNILAKRYIESAKGLMKKMFIDLPDPDLAYFYEGTQDFKDYMYYLS